MKIYWRNGRNGGQVKSLFPAFWCALPFWLELRYRRQESTTGAAISTGADLVDAFLTAQLFPFLD